jgi:ATP-binding cassette subfamily B (MDR/TAP) protein 1
MGLMNIFIRFNNMAAMLRNEVGWFDDEENSADNLSMRLANDATFVRAAFSNRLSIFIQDSAAVIVGLLIGAALHWRLALLAFATLPILCISAVAQVCTCSFGLPYIFPCYEPNILEA